MSSAAKRLLSAVLIVLVFATIHFARTRGLFSTEILPVQVQGRTMGSYYALSYLPPRADFGESAKTELHQKVESLLKVFEDRLSTYKPESPVSRFNRARTRDWIEVPGELIRLLEIASEVRGRSEKALDLTIAPLVKLWGFGGGKKRSTPPTPDEIARVRALVDQDRLRLDSGKSRIAKSMDAMEVDLNSNAPGYAADLVGQLLESQGIASYLVDIGGEIRARGEKESGQGWVVGVETPSEKFAEGVKARVVLRNLSLATSGNYRNYFEKDGVRYSHVLDPRTATPITHKLASVTVLHPEAAYADTWATTLLVLGPEDGMRVAEKEGLDVMMLVSSGPGEFEIRMTPGFRQRTLQGGESR